MSVDKLDASFQEIKDILDDYKDLKKQNSELVKELEAANQRVKEFNELEKENLRLKEKLEDARQTKKTLKRIETLEDLVENMNGQLKEKSSMATKLMKEMNDHAKQYVWAQAVQSRVRYLAEKLGVKSEGRNYESLISAIEDAVRKLRQ